MNTRAALFILLSAAVCGGCVTVSKQGPEVKNPAAALAQAKQKLQHKTPNGFSKEIPSVLGGVVKSDSWVIYKDSEREEFKGNVSYNNGAYEFRSRYALSDRKNNQFSASGDVFLRQNGQNASYYQAQADNARYNYKTQKGSLTADKANKITLQFKDEEGVLSTARAQRATFDLAEKIYDLSGGATLTRQTPKGLLTLEAQTLHAEQIPQKIVLDGGAKAYTPQYSLTAQTIVIDGQNNQSYAHGSRPLLQGKTEQGSFAIIADKVEAENESRKLLMDGKVQGWLVSDQINNAALNDKF